MGFRRFLMWPRWDDKTEEQDQRFGLFGMIVSIGGTFIGMPAAFCFLAIAWYGGGGLRFWFLGLASLIFGLWGLWQLFFGSRVRPGQFYRDKPK